MRILPPVQLHSRPVQARTAARRLLSLAAPLAGALLWLAPAARAADAAPGDVLDYDGHPEAYNGTWYDGEIHPYHVQGNIWLMAGEPGNSNVTLQVGDEGALIVDTGAATMADKLLAQIRQIIALHAGDQKAIRQIIDTSGLPDHIGGNAILRQAGSTIVAGNFAFDNPGHENGATVIANQNVLMRLVAENAAGNAAAAQALWPTDTEDFDVYDTSFNGEAVQLFHPHQAITDGDTVVVFRRSDVIVTGDTVDMVSYPRIDPQRGGSIDGELVALNHIIEMAVPEDKEEGGSEIIPGHGRICDQADVVQYKDMLTTIRNRIQYYKNQGRSLQQVLSIGPSRDFDARWGDGGEGWDGRRFVETVYRTLPAHGSANFSMNTETVVPANAGSGSGRVY